VRKPDGNGQEPDDDQGNPDTSFIVRVPADTPFLMQTIDKRGMALDIETSSRSVVRGEQQFCSGCHVHTRDGMNVSALSTKFGVNRFGDFTSASAPLFIGEDANGFPTVASAQATYAGEAGATARRSFAVDWNNNIATIVQNRCASCHADEKPAQQLTGLRLDGNIQTYELLTKNRYTHENGTVIKTDLDSSDGLTDLDTAKNRITQRYQCCTPSRWVSVNSARSSMLVWALYGERMDGRDPLTGLPPVDSGVVVDNKGYEHPEIWPKVGEHLAYLDGSSLVPGTTNMPEAEKRLIARWLDIGAPKRNVHDDMMRPVMTLTPVGDTSVSSILVGLWDDSPLDFTRFKVEANGADITPQVTGTPDTVTVSLPTTVTEANADSIEITLEIWDKPDRSWSMVRTGETAANRVRRTITGRALLRMADSVTNREPTAASASITTYEDTPSGGVFAQVTDPDIGDTHIISIASQPSQGTAEVISNKLVYTPNTGFVGNDSFQFTARDLGALSVSGTASVTVLAGTPPGNRAPTAASASITTNEDTQSEGVSAQVTDPDVGDTHSVSIVSQPANGSAQVTNNKLVYTPNSGFSGSDSFQFRATDPGDLFVDGTASVTVIGGFGDGSADGWIELTTSRWDEVLDEGDMVYYLNTTVFESPGEGRLGEYSLLLAEYGDFTFTAQAKLGDAVASNAFADYAVVFGFQDAGNYYYAIFNNDQDSTQLFKVVNGIRSALATADSDWLTDNLYHRIEVSRVGSEIKVNFDGALIMSASDSTFGAGQVGVGSFNDSAYFDDVNVVATGMSEPDTVAPVITLNGANPQTLTVGSVYEELGATASDNMDSDPTSSIEIDISAVNTAVVGSYSVTYNVSDTAENAATQVIRIVNVTAAVASDPDNSSSEGGGALGGGTGLLLLLAAMWRIRARSALTSGKRVLMRQRAWGLGLLMMAVPGLGLASVLSDLARTVQPGTFVELEIDGSVSTCEAMIPPMPLVDQNGELIPPIRPQDLGNILEFTDEAHWDSIGKEVYIAGTRRPYKPWDQGFVKYSEATNSWTILDVPPFGFGAHGYDNGALDVARGTFYWSRVAQANNVWSMSLETGEWVQLPNAPIAAGEQSALEFFPNIGKLVFFDARGGRASMYALYDPKTNQWDSPVSLAEPFGGISHFSEYNPSHGVMLFGGGHNYSAGGTLPDPTPNIDESRRLYQLDSDLVVTRLPNAPTGLGQSGAGPIQTIDPNSGNLVVFQGQPNPGSAASCPSPGPLPIWEYNLDTNSWGQTGTQQLSDRWCSLDTVAVPLPEYGVNFIVSVKGTADCKVYLYRHSPGTAELDIITQPASETVEQGQQATFNVLAVGSGVLNYQWRKNEADIAGATMASYSFIASNIGDSGAAFDVVVSDINTSITSSDAFLTINADTVAPTVVSASGTSETSVNVVFSEAVNAVSAENNSNYQIDQGIGVTASSLNDDGRTASLTVSQLTEDTSYTVSVSNVQDLAESPNTIIAQSSKDFTYRTADGFEDSSTDGWIVLTTSRWDVVSDEGDMAYYLNTTVFESPGEGRLGEYSLLLAEYGDFTFTAQAKLGDDVTSNAFADYAVVFGFQDIDNYYYAMFNNDQDSTQLFKVVNGIRSVLATADSDWLTDNLYHSIDVSRVDSEINVSFDGNLVMSASDSTFGVGQVGVGSFNDSAYFDDISVRADSSGGGTNSTPTAASAGITTNEDTQSEEVAPQVTDPDADDTHNFSIVSDPENGSAQVTNNKLVYTPNSGFSGSDSFQFRATDPGDLFVDGTASVTVLSDADDDTGGAGSQGPLMLLFVIALLLMPQRLRVLT